LVASTPLSFLFTNVGLTGGCLGAGSPSPHHPRHRVVSYTSAGVFLGGDPERFGHGPRPRAGAGIVSGSCLSRHPLSPLGERERDGPPTEHGRCEAQSSDRCAP